MSDVAADIERWAALLPPLPERIPTLVKVTNPTFAALKMTGRPADPVTGTPRFDAVPVVIDDDLGAPWIAYDQHGEEMGRG